MATKQEQRASLEAELAARLEMAQDSSYEGEVLTRGQQWTLFTAGIIIPFVLMAIGWVVK